MTSPCLISKLIKLDFLGTEITVFRIGSLLVLQLFFFFNLWELLSLRGSSFSSVRRNREYLQVVKSLPTSQSWAQITNMR